MYTPSLYILHQRDDLFSIKQWAQKLLSITCTIPNCMGKKYSELYFRESTLRKAFRFNEGTLGNDWTSSIYSSKHVNFKILHKLPSYTVLFCFILFCS